MAIRCARCGREYDVTLFGFGRTIWCTCGNRVGIAPTPSAPAPTAPLRFAADAMLGRLARWLRLLGFDCGYQSETSDAELVRKGVAEDRIILTRDRRLPQEWWVPNIYVVGGESLRDQLGEVLQRFDLANAIHLLSRCNRCNHLLARVARSEVRGRVAHRVFDTRNVFSECQGCGRIYWEGSHAARIRRFVDQLLVGR